MVCLSPNQKLWKKYAFDVSELGHHAGGGEVKRGVTLIVHLYIYRHIILGRTERIMSYTVRQFNQYRFPASRLHAAWPPWDKATLQTACSCLLQGPSSIFSVIKFSGRNLSKWKLWIVPASRTPLTEYVYRGQHLSESVTGTLGTHKAYGLLLLEFLQNLSNAH